MILTSRAFSELGQLLHGPRWRRWLAKRLDRSERTIIRYEDGGNIPPDVRRGLRDLIREQRETLEKWERELSA